MPAPRSAAVTPQDVSDDYGCDVAARGRVSAPVSGKAASVSDVNSGHARRQKAADVARAERARGTVGKQSRALLWLGVGLVGLIGILVVVVMLTSVLSIWATMTGMLPPTPQSQRITKPNVRCSNPRCRCARPAMVADNPVTSGRTSDRTPRLGRVI